MIINKDGNVFKTARITGPSHNMLGIEFGQTGSAPRVDVLSLEGQAVSPGLDKNTVLREVADGIAEANEHFGISYAPVVIQFVDSDTPVKGVYQFLAYRIVEYVVSQGGLSEAG